MPTYLTRNKKITLFFALPERVKRLSTWYAVFVFGTQTDLQVKTYPDTVFTDFSFPEKEYIRKPIASAERDHLPLQTPTVIEEVVKTKSDKRPQLTFFVMPPKKKPVSGVLALCLLANHPDDIRRQLELPKSAGEIGKMVLFAQTNQLAVVAWGSSKDLWDPRKNWNELSKKKETYFLEAFDTLANAWERGVFEISRKYQLPTSQYLLWGYSGSAQYAQRLALSRPRYFLAVHVHVPSSFDFPGDAGRRIIWCLTTGENESGYGRSLRFLQEAKKNKYPIVYKAYPGLGHSMSTSAGRFGRRFFSYALRVLRQSNESRDTVTQIFWRDAKSVADVVNQRIVPLHELKSVPESFRIQIPDELSNLWLKGGLNGER